MSDVQRRGDWHIAVGGDPPLDYYLIFARVGDRERGIQPSGILVEEFVLREDHTAAGIDSVAWTPVSGTWCSRPALSRGIRADAELRDRVVPVSRRDAANAYRLLGGGELPGETPIRAYFRDRQPLPASAPLDLGPDHAPTGTRRYRILFAKDLDQAGLANLRSLWRLEPADDPADRARVIGRTKAVIAGHTMVLELRRIGPGIAWCLDITAHLDDGPAGALATLLHQHRQTMREQGLIPVTIERFA